MKIPSFILSCLGIGSLFLFHTAVSTCRGQDAPAAPAAANGADAGAATPTWAFDSGPDDLKDDALLDLRYLNEKEAGESGFVKLDADGNFVLGNGKPIRFWAVNSDYKQNLAQHARFLAKHGVNMVRIFFQIPPQPNGAVTDVNKGDLDWCWKMEAAMKKEGIYSLISPYWPQIITLGKSWGIPPGIGDTSDSLLFFDPKMQDAYKGWVKALYTQQNPYTGMSLAEDPAVAVIQIQNEDSLLFWTFNGLKGDQRTNIEKLFGAWLTQKYGSLDKAVGKWGGAADPDDKISDGIVGLKNLWDLGQGASQPGDRLSDQTEFLGETMYNFNKSMADYYRNDLGCKSLLNAGNWKTSSDVRLNDVERWSTTPMEVSAVNHYVAGVQNGPKEGYAILNGDTFESPSVLLDPRYFPLNLKQIKGSPMLITESNWVLPTDYSTEGPFLVSAYQSLTGLGAYFWFNVRLNPEWSPPEGANPYTPSQEKWTFAYPDVLGTFPAAALMYRMNYIKRGETVVHEERPLDDLWQRKVGLISEMSGFDPNRDVKPLIAANNEGLPLNTFLVGPVDVVYGGDPSKNKVMECSSYLNADTKVTQSNTGEITMNNDKGFCTVNAPKAQGVTAFFKNQRDYDLQDVHIHSDNDYGSIMVVSMDDKPLKESDKILVQVGTHSSPTGWQEAPATITQKDGPPINGSRVVNYGKAPWQVTQAECDITVNNPGLSKGTVLDMNGNAAGTVSLDKTASGVHFKFPDKTMYVILN